ncbi:MAG: PIN domain-containing protein [Deltaproteobacteria bacterium]|nr:PIN domain-containing protein [Deltaproteobacteria bacterium]
MNPPPLVFLDACVLFSPLLRDLLVRLGKAGLCRPRWSREVQEEWILARLNTGKEPDRRELDAAREAMNDSVPEGLVSGYASRVEGITLPDRQDRHVVAAAWHSLFSSPATHGIILTYNLRDFPKKRLAPLGLTAQTPDRFLTELLESHPEPFLEVVRQHIAGLSHPPVSLEQWLTDIKKLKLHHTARRVTGLSSPFPLP